MPPCITPISNRAKKLIQLPDNVEGVIVLNEDPDAVLSAIPGYWIVGNEGETPTVVAIIEELAVLH